VGEQILMLTSHGESSFADLIVSKTINRKVNIYLTTGLSSLNAVDLEQWFVSGSIARPIEIKTFECKQQDKL
jgi:hypothetical protein